jgi:predicted DNA-binding transcriptional regulator AlpA
MASVDNHPSDEFISEEGLHQRYLIPPRTAQRWRSTGDGPRWIRLGRRRVLYRVADVEEWLNARTYRHRADELSRKAQS